jgi:hypothetical protein
MYTGDMPTNPCYERESRSQEELEMYTGIRPNDPCYERESRSQEELEMYTGDRPNDPCYQRESRSQEELEMYTPYENVTRVKKITLCKTNYMCKNMGDV